MKSILIITAFLLISFNGIAESVTSTIDGGIIKYLPSKGQIVKTGDILVKFDLTTIDCKIRKKKIELNLAVEDLKDKISDLKRYKLLSSKKIISEASHEDVVVSYFESKTKVESLKIDLEELESEKSDHIIRAPYDCKISERLITVNSGVEIGESLLSIEDLSHDLKTADNISNTTDKV